MNIKKEYIDKTKNYLKDLRMKITKKEMLVEEINLLKERERICGGISFDGSIKSKSTYNGIDDLIVTFDSKITSKEAQIDRIEHYIRMHELYSKGLTDIEKKILNARYLEEKNKNSFKDIAYYLRYSKSQVARMHDEAISKLAFYIYGEDSTYI